MVKERSGDLHSALRAIGGVLLALGSIVVLSRRSSYGHHWTDFELLLTIAAPAAVLFALAVTGRSAVGSGPADPARAVLLVSAVLLSPVAMFLFLRWAGASTRHLLYDAAALTASAAVAVAGARRAGAPYAMFLAGVALLGTWILVWVKILDHPSADTARWVLLSGGAVLILAAGALSVGGTLGAAELATAGSLGAVVAGLQGVLVGLFAPVFLLTSEVTVNESSSRPLSEPHEVRSGVLHLPGAQTTAWNIYLLLISLALVWCGSRSRSRGVVYVGFFGLAGFLYSVASQLARLESGHRASGSLLGWPLVLLLLGVVGLAAPMLRRTRS